MSKRNTSGSPGKETDSTVPFPYEQLAKYHSPEVLAQVAMLMEGNVKRLILDISYEMLHYGNARVQLHGKPLRLLKLFIERADMLLKSSEIEEIIWGFVPGEIKSKTFPVALGRLRNVFNELGVPDCIECITKEGYRLNTSLLDAKPMLIDGRELEGKLAGAIPEPRIVDIGDMIVSPPQMVPVDNPAFKDSGLDEVKGDGKGNGVDNRYEEFLKMSGGDRSRCRVNITMTVLYGVLLVRALLPVYAIAQELLDFKDITFHISDKYLLTERIVEICRQEEPERAAASQNWEKIVRTEVERWLPTGTEVTTPGKAIIMVRRNVVEG